MPHDNCSLYPLQVVGGPTVHIRLQAKVTIPTMTLSHGKVDFATIQCGQCLVETIQLSNNLQVPCEWFVQSQKPVDKVNELWPIGPPFSISISSGFVTLGLGAHHFNLLLKGGSRL